jgi:hypothetical protein
VKGEAEGVRGKEQGQGSFATELTERFIFFDTLTGGAQKTLSPKVTRSAWVGLIEKSSVMISRRKHV